jgi:DNA-directed RNA polymerase specialized sigma24 family protein
LIQHDSLLDTWFHAARTRGDDAAESVLAQLIESQIEPVIRGVIRFKLRLDGASRGEEDDLVQEALTQWLVELRKLGDQPDAAAIGDARGLAATISYRVCYAWLRRRAPRRHAHRNRLQYVLARQAGLAVWTGTGNQLIAGFAAWRGRTRAPAESLRRLPEDDAFLARAEGLIADPRGAKLNELLAAIFDRIGAPVGFDELVSVTAALLRIRDDPPASTDDPPEAGGAEFASSEDVAWQVEKRMFLERLWNEVCELPPSQRVALLLNLRETDGRGCLALFPATGIATLRQIAEALDLPAQRLAELWNELPLDDAAIAALLDLTRQQVINLRKSARERLARRLKGFF